jgi:hypothetical protein
VKFLILLTICSHHTEKGLADQTTFRLIDAGANVPLCSLDRALMAHKKSEKLKH